MKSKTKCSTCFSETIRKTMKEMGSEKSKPQVIAISAKRTIDEHPSCRKQLERPQERIPIDEKYWIVWSSKSLRLFRSKPCVVRVFFSKRQPETSGWRKKLQTILQERIHVAPHLGSPQQFDDYIELEIKNPRFLLALLYDRVANFLD